MESVEPCSQPHLTQPGRQHIQQQQQPLSPQLGQLLEDFFQYAGELERNLPSASSTGGGLGG